MRLSKLLWRLVSRCLYTSSCVFFYDKVEVTRTHSNALCQVLACVSKRLSTVARWRHGQSSLEAPQCSANSMRLSLNYFGVLFLVPSISRFVFVSTTTLNWAVCIAFQEKVYRQSPDGATEKFSSIFLPVCRILDKLHSLSNILCTYSIFIKMWAQI